jgi:hypothetical protein
MNKLILLSVIIAAIVIPVRAARAKNAKAGLKKIVKQVAIAHVVYLLALIFLWGRF